MEAAAVPKGQGWTFAQWGIWLDFNGVHALSGLLLFGPAFFFALRPNWALFYAWYATIALYATGIWAFFDETPAYVFTFPNGRAIRQ